MSLAKQQYIREYVESLGFVLVNDYERASVPLELRCPKGHTWMIRWDVLKTQARGLKGVCPTCDIGSYKISDSENQLAYFVMSFGFEVERNVQNIPNNIDEFMYEMDLYLPEINKCILLRSDVLPEDEFIEKYCVLNSIDLYTVQEDDWTNNRNLTMDNVRDFLYS